ncbi:hypothetical protein CMI47_09805 [Candidatus Pacearchaeota archaeon]|nr:hypothetical protein [Candidatus Pacearchaeota archaeon]|tara:strand:+ start:317 stop:1168 length:852 start_codon:yes stop_codon:yes gene_type:complete
MKTLVLGGTGKIGSKLKGDIKLSSSDVNLKSLDETLDCFRKYSPDVVINCAAQRKNYSDMINLQADHIYDNTMINLNIFKASQMLNIKKIVSLSSINALLTNNGEPHESCYSDGYRNIILNVLSKTYKSQYGISSIIPMLSNVYGPIFRGGCVVSILIERCYKSIVNNDDFIIDGDGSPMRNFIYVKDVSKIIEWLIQNYKSDEPIIISGDDSSNIKEIVEIIVDYMNFNGKVVWKKDASVGQSIKLCDNSRLRKLLPDFEFTGLRDGIHETIDWFHKHNGIK